MSRTLAALKLVVNPSVWCAFHNTTEFNLRRILTNTNPILGELDFILLKELADDGFSGELREDGFEPEIFSVLTNFAKLNLKISAQEPMLVTDIAMPIQQIFELINDCCDTDFVAKYFLSTDTETSHGLIYVLDRNAKQFMTGVLNILLPLYSFFMETEEIIFVVKK